MVATPNPKALLSRPPSPAKPKRPPLVPSDADNNNNAPPPLPRRMKSRDVSSRYLSLTDSNASVTMTSSSSSSSSSNSVSTPKRRFPSPLVTSSNLMTPLSKTTMNNSKRAVSTERRRPVTPRTGEKSVAAKMLTATPARSLSVSFQAQSVTVSKVSNSQSIGYTSGLRHCTPERRNVTPVRKLMTLKAVDQQRWPARSSVMTRSVDFTNEDMKLSGSGTVSAVRSLQKSMISETKLKPGVPNNNNDRSVDKLFSDSDQSNRESVASGSTIRGATPGHLMVPARFTQETVNRLRRVQSEPVSPQLSLSRGMPSPTRARGGVGSNNNNMGNTPSVLGFAAETRRRKVGDNTIVDAHTLRLLHNKHLQWQYANARADAAMLVQRATAEKSLYDARVTISKIRQLVISKQIEIQKLSQNLKLYTVLNNQMPYLKVCDQVERDHIVSLSEIIVALESSTLRLPLVDGAKVNVQSLKDAIRLAADVMHAMTSIIRPLVTKVEHVNTLASELANTTRNERSMINGCTDLFSILTHMEVQDCSLRAHLLQLQRVNDYRQQP